MLTQRPFWLAVLALLAAASPAAAQIHISVGRPLHPVSPRIGTVAGYRPPVSIRPPIGVVTRPSWPVRPVPPVISLRPNIYQPVYLSRFAPGYRTILLGNTAYYYYPQLLPGATFVTVGGVGYYNAGGVWLEPYGYGGQTVFLVVPPPV